MGSTSKNQKKNKSEIDQSKKFITTQNNFNQI